MGHLVQANGATQWEVRGSGVSSEARVAGIGHYGGLPAFALLQHAAQQIPARTAIEYGDLRLSYGELNRLSVRAAAMLQRIGVSPGQRVGILLPNVPEYVIAANAIWRAGGIALAISPLMVAEEVGRLLRQTGCRHVICLDMLSHLLDASEADNVHSLLVSIREHLPSLHQLGYLWERRNRTGRWTLPTTTRQRWFWQEIEATDQRWQPITINAESDAAYIIPTGGTTGSPKRVTLSHQNLVANAWQQYAWTGQTFGDETMLAVLPFFHSYGMSATVMAGTAMGATLYLHHRFNVRQTIRMIRERAPTVFHAVPAMLDALNQRLRTERTPLQGLRWVISGGAPLCEEIGSEFAEHTGALVVEGYGLSEASPVTHVGDLFAPPKFGTIGLPLPETECRIVPVDPTLHRCRQAAGELWVRGPQVMLGYWDDTVATTEVISDGWLKTGDLAVRDEQGCYRIVGRLKDLIITSGFNVYPAEVEAVLREADGVSDVAVIGQPCPRRGEVVKAVVVTESGAEWDESKLRAHCQERLSKHKRPRIYQHSVDELPKNFLGKVIRRELRHGAINPVDSANGVSSDAKVQ